MKTPVITLKRKFHNKAEQILICFDYNDTIIELVKTIPNRKWSQVYRCWYVKYCENALETIRNTLSDYNIDDSELINSPILKPNHDVSSLSQEQRSVLNGFFKYLKGKRYSKSTIDTYTFLVADFIAYHNELSVEALSNKAIELYIEDVYIKRQYSISKQRQFVSALKLFKNYCPELAYDQLELERPKRDRKLPTVISKEEIIHLIRVTKNLKHRAIIALIYSCGLRVSELIHLELKHIDIQRRQLLIRNAKGRKDRYVILAESFLPLLLNYIHTYEPKRFFVEGREGKQYSPGSIRKFLRTSCNRAGIIKRVTPHTLRHSYATHLLENGIDLRYIQELLGHAKPETTMIYTHVAKKDLLSIKSPLDIAVKQFMASEKEPSKVTLSRI